MPASKSEHEILTHDLREAYMEIFPAKGIEEKLQILPPNSYVAVTCSPRKGVDETLDLSEQLLTQGFRVVPHIAAKNVRNRQHVSEIMERLDRMNIDSIFCPGGDRPEPVGEFQTAYELLEAIDEHGHNIDLIGIAAHPEGHPDVDDDTLMKELERKAPLATYIVTQMCFDADLLGNWLIDLTRHGITLPVWIGLPGAIDRTHLIRTSMRIGVGDSLRFLRKKSQVAAELMKSSEYRPDELVSQITHYQALPETNVAGYHLFCFNQVENTENWRKETIECLK